MVTPVQTAVLKGATDVRIGRISLEEVGKFEVAGRICSLFRCVLSGWGPLKDVAAKAKGSPIERGVLRD